MGTHSCVASGRRAEPGTRFAGITTANVTISMMAEQDGARSPIIEIEDQHEITFVST